VIGIDTNVLLRHLTQDDPEQSARATDFMRGLSREDPGFISLVTLVETAWTLRSRYRAGLDRIAHVVLSLVETEQLVLQEPDTVVRAARDSLETRAELADLLVAHMGVAHGCDLTVTFDRKASTLPGMKLLE
jgi:predicted nucleic-acid-binding protein